MQQQHFLARHIVPATSITPPSGCDPGMWQKFDAVSRRQTVKVARTVVLRVIVDYTVLNDMDHCVVYKLPCRHTVRGKPNYHFPLLLHLSEIEFHLSEIEFHLSGNQFNLSEIKFHLSEIQFLLSEIQFYFAYFSLM